MRICELDPMWGWTKNDKGNWYRRGLEDGEEFTTIFKRDYDYRIARDGLFSIGSYETPAEAAVALDQKRVRWINPYRWILKKDGSGWYRRPREGGTISIKQAKSGLWYWTHSEEPGANGWFSTADAAKAASSDRFDE